MAFTYFFRDMQTLRLLTENVIPVLKGNRYIRVWDAGCAHGPEPYSVAIMIRENMSRFLFRNVHISATDIDISSQFGKIIKAGVYPKGEIQRIPEDVRQKYFKKTAESGYYQISEEIRKSVEYTQHDLLSLNPIRTGFNLIICKNVLLHFSCQQRIDVIRMYHSALHEGGFFITEQTQKLPIEVEGLFERLTNHGQLFRKKN